MKGGILPQKHTAGTIMSDSMWWLYDGIVAIVLIVSFFFTAKRGLIKGIVSMIGFILSVIIAITVSGAVSNSLYRYVVRTSTIRDINKHINEDTLIEQLSYQLENSEYNINVNNGKLRGVISESNPKSYDHDIYSYMNNINGKKIDDEEPFIENLHIAYSNVVKELIKYDNSTYNIEYAAQKVLEKPSLFTECIPLLLEKEDQKPAAVYLCDTFLAEPYNKYFRLMALTALFAACILLTFIFTQAAGRNDKMEPGIVRHFFCGLMGLVKGVALVFIIAVIIRISIISGSNKSVMFSHTDIDTTYAFKYVYDFVCGLN